MYNGELNISTTVINSTLNWQGETYEGVLNINQYNFTGTLAQQIVMLPDPILENRVTDLENSWYHYATLVEYTGVDTVIATGNVLECVYDGATLYRYITTAESVNGYPLEDSFYSTFDGTTLSDLITTR